MGFTGRPDLFELLKNDIKDQNLLLDVGSDRFQDLIAFERSNFNKLIALDKTARSFKDYWETKVAFANSEELQTLYRQKENYGELFKLKYKIETKKFERFDFFSVKYSLIICNKVLHFYNDSEKLHWIKTFYDSLEKDGLLYIQINHDEHPQVQEFKEQGKPLHPRMEQYINPDMFIALLSEYNILKKYNHKSDRTYAFVIKK